MVIDFCVSLRGEHGRKGNIPRPTFMRGLMREVWKVEEVLSKMFRNGRDAFIASFCSGI